MSNLTRILTMNKKQVSALLENHQLFSKEEIKLAAKMMVSLEKEPTDLDRYYASLQNMGMRGSSGAAQYSAHNQQGFGYSGLFCGAF